MCFVQMEYRGVIKLFVLDVSSVTEILPKLVKMSKTSAPFQLPRKGRLGFNVVVYVLKMLHVTVSQKEQPQKEISNIIWLWYVHVKSLLKYIAIMNIPTHQIIELTPRYVFQHQTKIFTEIALPPLLSTQTISQWIIKIIFIKFLDESYGDGIFQSNQ